MSWPASLPSATVSGFDLETTSACVRTDMESGTARMRRRFTATPDNITLCYVFKPEEMVTFRAFWRGEFNFGAAWVDIPLKTGTSAGMETKSCRVPSGTFHATLAGVNWIVELQVEVRHA